MYCPKCNQNFEEGSRRFCPTDGARLVSESASSTGDQTPGIFANLLPKMGGISDLGAKLSGAPGVFVSSGDNVPEREDETENDDAFFELDDDESEADTRLLFEPTKGPDDKKEPLRPPVDLPLTQSPKKVDPTTIPEGGIDSTSEFGGPDVFASFDADNPQDLVGRRVKGRYQVIEFLGAEETGLAYLAEDKIGGGKTVLVRIHADSEVDEMMDSILAEERISLSHFSHPNTARFIDSGEFVNGVPFIISEHVDGLTVADILAIHRQFDLKRASRIIRQISNALNEAHQEGILHRDIRPENLVIDPDSGEVEQAKLVNFGASGGLTSSDNLSYKSPEVLDGRINTIVSDIFSLGVVAYEMLTGRLPFDGESKNELLRAQYAGPSPLPSALRPELPKAVDDVLIRALGFKPAERYKKAREFGDALTAALSGTVVETEPGQAKVVELQPIVTHTQPAEETVKGPPRIQIPPIKRTEEAATIGEDELPISVGEPENERGSRVWYIAAAVATLLVVGSVLGWYYFADDRNTLPVTGGANITGSTDPSRSNSALSGESEPRPASRNLAQPPNTNAFQNARDDLKGDLLDNFVGFSIYYPKEWKAIGPQPGASAGARGKFLDISKSTADGRLQEQMLVSYYPSSGTFAGDTSRFPLLVQETNSTLEKILPGYQKVSEGPVTLDGGWRAYEVKFQGGGISTGNKLMVWGRRLFVPAARAGAQSGFEITMLATSHSENVRSVDDVGVRGELGPVLSSFEPSPNF